MDLIQWESVFEWLTVGGGVVALLSLLLTHKQSRDNKNIDLVARLSDEIKRLDAKIAELEDEIVKHKDTINEQIETLQDNRLLIAEQNFIITRSNEENIRLQAIINELKESVEVLKNELAKAKEK